jgi:DNA-binding winged helix-turn-helix (wHTH) protein/tetratricopeptide (TPR) repeat protein
MTTGAAIYRFGPFTLDAVSFRLYRAGAVIALSPKILDLLLYLVSRPSTLVTKEELFRALWPDVIVTDNALTQAVSELRQALGDDPASPVYVQTVARRGYRFVAPVEAGATPGGTGAAGPGGPAAGLPRAIAVTDFSNVTGDADFAWLSSGIAETVTNDLRELGTLRVIDRAQVAEALRHAGGTIRALRTERIADLAVVGSFQRAGDRLRITARVIDLDTGEALADAKADGALSDVFDLQDRLVAQFATQLGLKGGSGSERRVGIRETSSLEAYQAFTEGRVKLEALESALPAEAIADFERALQLDPRYALAEVGLANARFFLYELSRARNQPDAGTLAAAIDHARRAIELDRNLAEAHATLAFLLVSAGRSREALAAGRRAVALEPGYWGNQFRLAHAAWGEERLRALARALELYPEFPFVHFEAAMVHIARGALDRAEQALREGAVGQDRQLGRRQRYPVRGLHWLLGLVRLARGDFHEAAAEFEREIESARTQLYAAEFAMNAYDGLGFVRLLSGQHPEAIAAFRHALDRFPDHARSRLGVAAVLRAEHRGSEADAEFAAARRAIAELRRGGRSTEALMAEAFEHAIFDRRDQAVATLERLLAEADLSFAGWIIPIEPFFRRLHGSAGFDRVLATLADRAR